MKWKVFFRFIFRIDCIFVDDYLPLRCSEMETDSEAGSEVVEIFLECQRIKLKPSQLKHSWYIGEKWKLSLTSGLGSSQNEGGVVRSPDYNVARTIIFVLLLMFVLMKCVYCEARSDSSYQFLFSFLSRTTLRWSSGGQHFLRFSYLLKLWKFFHSSLASKNS